MTKDQSQVYGLHSVQALLLKQPGRILRLCVQKERRDEKIERLLELAQSQNLIIEQMPRETLDRLVHEGNHQGVVVYCKPALTYNEKDLPDLLEDQSKPPLILILDGVQDPHNLGACFRSADAANVQAIIVPKDNSVGLTPVVNKVASGAVETVPFVQVTNLVRTIEKLKELGIWIYGAADDATQTLYQTDLKGPTALVMGAEGSGLRRLTKEHCDVLLSIPMYGFVSSLNVSVATGVCLYEAIRQRNF